MVSYPPSYVILTRLKPGKAAGIDDVLAEMIQHLGPKAKTWLLEMLNSCMAKKTIPPVWRNAKTVAIPKPGKDPSSPKSYRPAISLLCTTCKLYERLLLQHLTPLIDPKLTKDQAGFRPGRSCAGQLLNLTQHIEDGFERKLITGAAFIDLTAAYDTVQHRAMTRKLLDMTGDLDLCQVIKSLLNNRRFFVQLNDKKSKWKAQKNGLPQGSILAPLLFNIYTNDQPLPPQCRRFIYADDLCITTQQESFHKIESVLESALQEMSTYYNNKHLKPNPSKTQLCSFHLKNRDAGKELSIS